MGPFLTQTGRIQGAKANIPPERLLVLQRQLRRGLGKLSAQLHKEDKETGTTAWAYLQHIKHQQVNQSTINPLDSDPSSQMLPDPSAGDQQEKSSSMAGAGHQENKTGTPSTLRNVIPGEKKTPNDQKNQKKIDSTFSFTWNWRETIKTQTCKSQRNEEMAVSFLCSLSLGITFSNYFLHSWELWSVHARRKAAHASDIWIPALAEGVKMPISKRRCWLYHTQ